MLKLADSPNVRARCALGSASVVELAEMVVSGRKPTIGWYRRARAKAAEQKSGE